MPLLALWFRYIKVNPLWEARFWFLFICVAIVSSACGILKVSLGRARPSMWLEQKAFGFYGWHMDAPFMSFPSGHTSIIMSLAFALSILFPRYGVPVMLAGFVVALSRVLLVHHYLSDVLTASYLALIGVGIILAYLQKKSWLQRAWSGDSKV